MKWIGGKPTEPAWLYGVAGVLMLGGPVGRELYLNHYPARPEAFLLPLIAGAIGAIVAVGSWRVGGIIGTIAFGGLLFVFTDLQLDPERWTYTAVVLVGCIVLMQLLSAHRAAICALSLGALYLTSVVRPSIAPPPARMDAEGTGRPTNPVLVHIVFDAHWGVGALRAVGDTQTADFLTDFYLTRGFHLYEAAYSRHMDTRESFRSVIHLGETPTDPMPQRGPYVHSMRRNPYFRRLHELGYAIRVYQSTHLDFCNSETAVVSCEVQSANSIANVGLVDGSWLVRGFWGLQYFLSTRSHVFARLMPGPDSWRRALAGGALATGRDLSRAMASHPSGGTAWFVHVLLPHRPFQVDKECRIQNDPSRYLDYGLPAHPSDSLWRAALGAYAGQVRCAHRILADVIDAVDSTVGREHSIVIVHGDHGSWLHPEERHDYSLPLSKYSASELNTHFATLLAVRRPQDSAALHRNPVPVQDIIRQLAQYGFSGAVSEEWPAYISRLPDREHPNGQVRALTAADMPWARRPD